MRGRAEPCAHEGYKHLHQYGAGRWGGSAEGLAAADNGGRRAESGGIHAGRMVRRAMRTHAASAFQTEGRHAFPRQKSLTQMEGRSSMGRTHGLEVNLTASLICFRYSDHLSC